MNSGGDKSFTQQASESIGNVASSITGGGESTSTDSHATHGISDDGGQSKGIEAGRKVKELGDARDASQEEKDRAYEERMEDEYAKREGGA